MGGFIHPVPVYPWINRTAAALWLLWLTACNKPQVTELSFTEIPTGMNGAIHAIISSSDGRLIAAGEHSGRGILIQSADNGNTWTELTSSFEYPVTAILSIDSVTLYAGTAEPAVYKSTDGGINWMKLWVRTPFPPQYRKPVRSIAALNDTTLFFALGGEFEAGGIWKTYDGGTLWKAFPFNFELRDILFTSAYNGIACGFGNMVITDDAGESWRPVACPDDYFMSMISNPDDELWAVTFCGGLYSTRQPVSQWNTQQAPARVFTSRNRLRKIAGLNEMMVAAGYDGLILKSDNKGKSWSQFISCNGNDLRCILINGNRMVAGGNEGMIYLIE